MLFRLITGHVQLQQHLHRTQVVDSPICEFCETAPETVAHYILRCKHFSSERYIYLESHGYDFSRLEYLFFASEALLPLFDYIKATNRFPSLLR